MRRFAAMLAALDVDYDEGAGRARAAAVLFEAWTDVAAVGELVRVHTGVRPYRPGRFFERELPCLLPLLDEVVAESCDLQAIIVDGYVDLDEGAPGLGRRLFEALNRRVEVIGVAKNRFADAEAVEVFRGRSTRPLYVTSTGDPQRAAACVRSMHGAFRIPTLLRRADRLAREG